MDHVRGNPIVIPRPPLPGIPQDGGRACAAARAFADQIIRTVRPFLARAPADWRVLDVGCGYGHTALELSRVCTSVVGIEPSAAVASTAHALKESEGTPNLEIRTASVYEIEEVECYDLVVLDNVLEHLPDQPRALALLTRSLRPGGAIYILVPNKLWPIEVHYYLPFLSYLPLRLANWYLRLTGRGLDYTDASYAPTYFGLKRLLKRRGELTSRFVLPADLSLSTGGRSLHYRLGTAALRRFPPLWVVSKAFLVVAIKTGNTAA